MLKAIELFVLAGVAEMAAAILYGFGCEKISLFGTVLSER